MPRVNPAVFFWLALTTVVGALLGSWLLGLAFGLTVSIIVSFWNP